MTAGYVSLPQPKTDKLTDHISSMRKSLGTIEKSLEKLVGLLNWVTQIFLLMRCWLPVLSRDLYQIPASHYSIDPGHWRHVMECLKDELHFFKDPYRYWSPGGQHTPAEHGFVCEILDPIADL